MGRFVRKIKAKMRNAQITLFLIIGIVILLGAGLLIYMVSITPEKKGEETVVGQTLRQQAVQPVKDYITTCLDIVSSDALELVGKQGGRLYQEQGSIIPNPSVDKLGIIFMDYDDLKLSYSIVPPKGNVGALFFSDVPEYPWPSFPYTANGNTSDLGYFGLSRLPALYKNFSTDSIQQQLETYISNNIAKCTLWDNKFPGFKITTGTPMTTMIIAENLTHLRQEEYISFVLDWPVTITEESSGARITLDRFTVNYPVAFGRMYYTIKSIVEAEISNMSYEPITTDAYFITINNNAYNKDDIIVYQDKKYSLKGVPYEFRIARKNRAPALHLIDQKEIDKFAYCVDIVKFSLQGNKLYASPDLEDGDPFPLNSTAIDPDNDVISFKLKPTTPKVDSYAVALYKDNPAKGGLLFKVYADDGELEDYQQIRIIPKGCAED